MPHLSLWQTPIREGCYLVGHRNPESLLQCNTWLRTFDPGSARPGHWCIDPGSQIDYPHVRDQDPDVVGNLTFLTRENPKLTGVVTQDVWRLVRHLEVKPHSLYFAEQSHNNQIKLPSGQLILAACSQQGIPLPQLGVGVEEVGGTDFTPD
jgi:hypothetical protein